MQLPTVEAFSDVLPERVFFNWEMGFGGGMVSGRTAEVPEAQLRIQPWVLSRFIASLKAGPFLLILLIKGICFVKQTRPFIRTENHFMRSFGFLGCFLFVCFC